MVKKAGLLVTIIKDSIGVMYDKGFNYQSLL